MADSGESTEVKISPDEARKLLEQAMAADENVRARYYAEIFACLMDYPEFEKFVAENYSVVQYIDHESGILAVRVDRNQEPEEGSESDE
tara:strand:- start:175 stop:441 length:267 start_codon:yes stop_codon:yes gene_type:complete